MIIKLLKKHACVFIFIAATFLLFAFALPQYNLIGKWSILNPDGSPNGEIVTFNKDNTYTVSLPDGSTIGERGDYLLSDSIFSIKNIKNVCGNGYWGRYVMKFYGNDSVHLTLIADTCTERRMDLVGYNPGLKRDKMK